MTRRITYANQLANSINNLEDANEAMIELAMVVQAILGNGTPASPTDTLPLFTGFEVTPTGSPSLNVEVAGGVLFSWEVVDATAFGELPTQIPADNINKIAKLAWTFDTTTIPFIPPGTPGFSRNDVVTLSFSEDDGNAQNIPFFAGFTVGAGFAPPNYISKFTQRIDSVVVTVTTGTAAATGTQTTPNVPAGSAGSMVVTTANGQTTIISGNITTYSGTGAGRITETLTQKISKATADALYAPIGSANHVGTIIAYTGTIASIPAGWLRCLNQTLNRTTYATLFANTSFTQTGSTTSGSAIVTGLSDTSEMFAGMQVTGTGITGVGVILTVDSATQITLTANATATGTPSIRFYINGAGNGTTTFNAPNGAGRSLLGSGAGSGLTARIPGQVGGAEEDALTIAQLATHNHPPSEGSFLVDVGSGGDIALVAGGNAKDNGLTGNTGDGDPHNTMHPYVVQHYIVYTGVI